MESIHSEVLESGVHLLTFDRPDSGANIFDVATLTELEGRLDTVDKSATGVVFMSAKPSIFIAGADLHAMETLNGDELRQFIELGQSVFNRIAALPIPSVAAIHGACVGGGYELCLACRWRVATRDHVTKIGLPETQLGILPAWGGSTRLTRLIGVPRALDIILGGKTLPAKAALRRGMIDDIAPRELLLPAALKLMRNHRPNRAHGPYRPHVLQRVAAAFAAPIARRRIAEKSHGHYPALTKALEVVTGGARESLGAALQRERTAVMELAATPECRNLIRVFQLQERAKKLRVPGVEKPAKINHVAVIGAGVMGSAIAQWLSSRGLRVLMRDIDPERVAAGMGRIAGLYASAVKRRIIDAKEARDGMDRVSPAGGGATVERHRSRHRGGGGKNGFEEKDFCPARRGRAGAGRCWRRTRPRSPSRNWAKPCMTPAAWWASTFFNPVHRMPLVEVVTGKQTSPETTAAALRFVQQIGKMPVVVRDSPGFLVNRILLPYLVEAGDLFAHGASARQIDAAMLDFGMPMGPLRLIDEVGLDVAEDVAATLAAAFPDHLRVPPSIGRMARAGLLGKKSGRGYYLHDKRSAKPNPDAAVFREAADAAGLDRLTLQRRMTLLIINEAARCIEEQVVAEPADVDFGMIMGAGFAPFRGGPLRYADSLGATTVTEALRDEAGRSGSYFAPCRLLQEMSQTNRRFYADH